MTYMSIHYTELSIPATIYIGHLTHQPLYQSLFLIRQVDKFHSTKRLGRVLCGLPITLKQFQCKHHLSEWLRLLLLEVLLQNLINHIYIAKLS